MISCDRARDDEEPKSETLGAICRAAAAMPRLAATFMQNNQPKFLTKDELRSAAVRELKVSKNAFDLAWMAAIEDTGRHDWYDPLRKRARTKT